MDPQVFSQIDSDGDGYVSRDEWEDFSRRKSCPAELVTKVSAFIGKDFGERVSKAEFIDYMDRIWEDQENVISDDERSSMGIRRDGSLDEDIRTNFLGGGLSKSFDEGDVGIQRLNGDTFEERLGKCSEENQKLKDENKGLKNKIEGLEKILREYEAEQKEFDTKKKVYEKLIERLKQEKDNLKEKLMKEEQKYKEEDDMIEPAPRTSAASTDTWGSLRSLERTNHRRLYSEPVPKHASSKQMIQQQQQQQQQGKIAESQWKELKTLIIKSHEELGKTVKTVNDKISESFRNISGQLSSSFGSQDTNNSPGRIYMTGEYLSDSRGTSRTVSRTGSVASTPVSSRKIKKTKKNQHSKSPKTDAKLANAKRNREIYAKKKKEEKKEQEERRKAKIKARSFDFDKNPPQTPTAKKKKKQQQAKKTSVSSTMGEEGEKVKEPVPTSTPDQKHMRNVSSPARISVPPPIEDKLPPIEDKLEDGETMDGLDTTVTTPICTPNNRSTRNNMDESREEVAKTAIHDVTESIKKHIKKMSDEALSRIRQSGGSEDEMKQIKSELQKETKDVQKILEIMKTVKKDVKDVADRKDANTKALAPPQTNSLVKIQKEIKSELKNSLQVITDTIKTSGKREEYPAVLVLVWIAVVIAAFCWRSDDLDIQYT